MVKHRYYAHSLYNNSYGEYVFLKKSPSPPKKIWRRLVGKTHDFLPKWCFIGNYFLSDLDLNIGFFVPRSRNFSQISKITAKMNSLTQKKIPLDILHDYLWYVSSKTMFFFKNVKNPRWPPKSGVTMVDFTQGCPIIVSTPSFICQ